MKIDCLFTAGHKRLANLPKVVERLVRKDMPWFTRPMSPRSLLFGLYVHYQNTRLRVKTLEDYLSRQTDRVNALQARIKALEEYERQVIYKDFTATITTFHWDCGDGCCSDSWCGYKVYNGAGLVVDELDGSGEKTYLHVYEARERIQAKYGPISISEDDDYSQSSSENKSW